MSNSPHFNEPLILRFGENESKQFQTFDQLAEWADDESVFWQRILHKEQLGKIQSNNVFNQLLNTARSTFLEIPRQLRNLAINSKSGSIDFNQLRNEIRSIGKKYAQYEAIYSKSSIGKHIQSLFEDDPLRAYQLLSALHPACKSMAQHNYAYNAALIAGLIEEKLFSLGTKSSFRSARKHFDDLATELQTRIQNSDNHASQVNTQLAEWEKDYELALGKLELKIEELEKLATEQRENFHNLFEQQKRFFIEDLQLQAPITYWKGVAKHCQKKVGRYAWTFGLASVAFTGGFFTFGYTVLATHDYAKPTNWWLIPCSLLAGGLGLWSLRLIARVMISYMHRHADAEARKIMVQTYLAIRNKEGADAFKEHAHILLEALFRPTADGLVKDDALPLAYLDIITRNKS